MVERELIIQPSTYAAPTVTETNPTTGTGT
jgi:hypothetical protein